MVKLTGKIIRETKDAVLLKIEEDEQSLLKGKTEWFAKSKIKISKNRHGKDVVRVQQWLYEMHLPAQLRIGEYKYWK